MDMKIVRINKRGYGRSDVIIDELGVVLKDMSYIYTYIRKGTKYRIFCTTYRNNKK